MNSCFERFVGFVRIMPDAYWHQTAFARPTDVYMKSGLHIDVHSDGLGKIVAFKK